MGGEPPEPGGDPWNGEPVTTIRASCPACGDVQLTAADVTVRLCADDDRGSYCFRCPGCAGRVVKDASRRVVDLLVAGGVRLDVWSLPAELSEPRREGPSFSEADVDEFGALLQSDGWFDHLAAEVGGSEDR